MTFINKNNNNKKKERDKQTNTFQVSSICFQILFAVVCVLYGRRQRLSKHSCLTQMERAEKHRTKVTTKNQPKYDLRCWRSALLSGGGEKNERSFIFLSALKTADCQHGRLAQVKTTFKSGGAFN